MKKISAKDATAMILKGIADGQYEAAKIALEHLKFGDKSVGDVVFDNNTISLQSWAGNTVSVKLNHGTTEAVYAHWYFQGKSFPVDCRADAVRFLETLQIDINEFPRAEKLEKEIADLAENCPNLFLAPDSELLEEEQSSGDFLISIERLARLAVNGL